MKTKLFFIILAITSLRVSAQTTVPGGSVSGNWALAGSPYNIQGSIMIPDATTLTIEPGVTVNFLGHYKLLVLGRLLAMGTVTNSIYFTASNTTIGWYGIRFDNTPSTNDTSKLYYCNIQWGNTTNNTGNDGCGGGFFFNNFSKVIVSNSLIKNNSDAVTTSGGAIYCINSSPIISYNEISYCRGGIHFDNTSTPQIFNNTISYNAGTAIDWIGGSSSLKIHDNTISYNDREAIYCTNSSAIISNNTISHNNPSHQGSIIGGIRCDGSTVTITNNIISYNAAFSGAEGGGIFCYYSNAIITDNIISNNISESGGAISCETCNPIISNNVISNNSAVGTYGNGGAIACYDNSNPVCTNNTIVNNTALNGGGIYCKATCNPSFINCIIYGNTASTAGAQVFLDDEPSDPAFSYCDVQGGSATIDANGGFYTGTYTSNININPTFVTPSGGSGSTFNGVIANWSLQTGSACINGGNPVGTYPATDIAGNTRVNGAAIDIGAYEFQGPDGIADYDLQNKINIYPNPFSTSAVIQFSISINNADMNIYNLYGQLIQTIHHVSGNKFVISRDNLPTGIYFICVTQNNKTIITDKLIIAD